MTSVDLFAGRLAGQLAASWGGLSAGSHEVLRIHSGLSLPHVWDRVPIATQTSLETAIRSRPGLLYSTMAVLGVSEETARRGLGRQFNSDEFVRVGEDCRHFVQDHQEKVARPAALRKQQGQLDEKSALRVFREASAETLNLILWDLHRSGELSNLVNDFLSGILCWNNKRQLLHLLSVERLSELSVPVRAALVRSLQKGITGAVAERAIANIMTGTKAADFVRLKNLIDQSSPQDMVEMAYHDVDSWLLRRRILKHIQAEAGQTRPDLSLLFSDIDDTVWCNWKDERYPKKTVYPGMHAFYRALGRFDKNDWERRGPAFASARPEEGAGIVEAYTVDNLREIGFPSPTVLSGDLLHIVGASIADAKYKNFVSYDSLFPEFTKILLGDNGQYDVDFAKRAMGAYAEVVLAGFIHDVVGTDVERMMGYDFEVIEAPAATRRLFYFDTYLGAALAALSETSPLIGVDDMHQVAREAFWEFERIAFDDEIQQARIWNFLKRDFDAAQRKYGKIEL